MISTIAFEIPGTPHAKQRARIGRGFAFTPTATVNAETFIRLIAMPHFAQPLTGPVSLDITAVFAPPQSWSGAKTRRTLGSPHTQRPDLDNCIKTLKDALNQIAFGDDSQVAVLNARKVWGQVAKTVVIVRSIYMPEDQS